jgi:hypothetical protein
MPQLYLPAAHTDADLVLASQIAARIDSAELHVAWSPEHGQVAPQIPAVVRDAPVSAGSVLAILLGVARDLWLALFRRDDKGAVLPAPSSEPAADAPQPKPAS